MRKRLFNILKWITLGLIVLAIAVLKPIPDQPLDESTFYPETMENIEAALNKKVISEGTELKIGWSKKTLLDGNKHPMAGYGARMGVEYGSVIDSIWVRTVFFDNGKTALVYISFDLLIAPPVVHDEVISQLAEIGLEPEQIYMTATHSHSSLGGWQKGVLGRLMAGEYEPETVHFICEQVIESIKEAKQQAKPARIGAGEVDMRNMVRNRLVGSKEGTIDPWLKMIKIENDIKEEALITSYSAHPTCLQIKFTDLSADYPGPFVVNMEADSSIDFALFSAGAMASMGPVVPNVSGLEKVKYMADHLSDKVLKHHESIPVYKSTKFEYFSAPISLPVPSFKVTTSIALRGWIFDLLVGEPTAEITSMKIGNILFIGLPCDFSGELSDRLYEAARKKGMFLVINSFNGDYMGYVSKDEWYFRDRSETKSMNWYGPNMGKFFTDIMLKVIDSY